MAEFHDLTYRYKDNLPVYPGDPSMKLFQVADYASAGFFSSLLTLPLHCGTHIDAPVHMWEEGKWLHDYPPGTFTGQAIVIDVGGLDPVPEDVLEGIPLNGIRFVLLRTGHSSTFNTEAYYSSYPALSEALGKRIAVSDVKILGLDTPSPDYAPYPVHHLLFRADKLILENLTNLDRLPEGTPFRLFAFPLHIQAEASPVRVIARVGSD